MTEKKDPIEQAAKAAYDSYMTDIYDGCEPPFIEAWESCTDYYKDRWRKAARAAVGAYIQAGGE